MWSAEPLALLAPVVVDGGCAFWAKGPDGRWVNQGSGVTVDTVDDLIEAYGRLEVVELTGRFVGEYK